MGDAHAAMRESRRVVMVAGQSRIEAIASTQQRVSGRASVGYRAGTGVHCPSSPTRGRSSSMTRRATGSSSPSPCCWAWFWPRQRSPAGNRPWGQERQVRQSGADRRPLHPALPQRGEFRPRQVPELRPGTHQLRQCGGCRPDRLVQTDATPPSDVTPDTMVALRHGAGRVRARRAAAPAGWSDCLR